MAAMAYFIPHVKTHYPISRISSAHIPLMITSHNNDLQIPAGGYGYKGKRGALKSAKGDSVWEIERKLEDKNSMVIEEEEEEMGKIGDKCKGIGGMVEMLECLEREAIMGEDEGKEPMDYNRRAQIFYKSSRVFQALKERGDTTTTST